MEISSVADGDLAKRSEPISMNIFLMKQSNNRTIEQGFSLIEVVIASGILAVSIASIMTLALYTQRNTRYLAEKTFAVLKAGDGIELVRHKRDTNLKDKNPDTDWNYQLNKSALETIDQTFTFEGKSFKRTVSLSDCLPAPCQEVSSQVEWSGGAVELKTQLTDWRLET